MDILLSKVTQQAMNYAIRSGITITSTYAIRQCSRLLKSVKGNEREELASLQLRLEAKIRIISPAIDMIELIAARGNTSLESAVTLTKTLRWDIQSLGVRIAKAVAEEELIRRGSSRAKSSDQADLEFKLIVADIRKLLEKIEDAVPLINLAITTSGASLTTSLPATVSPSRLLQASTFLTGGDTQFAMSHGKSVQIGPVFTLSLYMLFSGHAFRGSNEDGFRETTWKEVIHKARVKLLRIPLENVYGFPCPDGGPDRQSQHPTSPNVLGSESHRYDIPAEGKAHEFAYQILVVEDLDDDRVHTFEDGDTLPRPYEGVDSAGVREIIPIHEISKIFYADTGKILNIGTDGEVNNPVLLLKRDPNAVPPRRMMENLDVNAEGNEDEFAAAGDKSSPPEFADEQSEIDAQLFRESPAPPTPAEEVHPQYESNFPWRLSSDLDPEWMAFEVYTEAQDSDSDLDSNEAEVPSSPPSQGRSESVEPSVTAALSQLDIKDNSRHGSPAVTERAQIILSPQKQTHVAPTSTPRLPTTPTLRTSLSLLEMLIRLTALQQFQQSSHLAISDELLNFFLAESSTVGAGGDTELRKRVRRDARRRVGFDPYDESPIKRRGEEYLAHMHDRGATPEGDYDQYGYENDDAEFNQYSDLHVSNPGPPNVVSPRSEHRQSTPHSRLYSPSLTARSLGRSYNEDVPIPSREYLSGRMRASPSPLLRRATAPNARTNVVSPQPSGNRQLRTTMKEPLTAPPTSSSPRPTDSSTGLDKKPVTPKKEKRPAPIMPETPPET